MAHSRWFLGLIMAAAVLAACTDAQDRLAPTAPSLAPAADVMHYVPSPLTTVTLAGQELQIWPYTADSLPAVHVDPINLVFVGPYADPRSIRAALLGTGGDRSDVGLGSPLTLMLPGVFDCHWTDGIGGGNQAAYVDGKGWEGSVIQLTCGPYNYFRFHVRLMPFGNVTLAGAHFEMNIPGTADHESLSWELARLVVVSDLARAGRLAAAPGVVNTGSQMPTYRSVRPQLYPYVAPLLQALGAPTADIPNSGQATVIQLAEPPAAAAGSSTVSLDLTYGVDMPKPFCEPGDFLHVAGPVHLSQTTTLTAEGAYSATFEARALVDVTPLVGGNGPFQAEIHQVEASMFNGHNGQITSKLWERMIPSTAGLGFQVKSFLVGPGDATVFQNQIHCYGN